MRTVLTSTILLVLAQFCYAQDFWVQISRPVDAGVYSLVVDAELNLIAGMGNYGGVHLTDNQGKTWHPIGLGGIGVLCMLVHPNGSLYAGVNRYNSLYLMESIEEGWIPILSDIGNVISISILQSGDLFIGNWGEIYKSTDLGETWLQVLELDNTQVVNSIVENPDGILFAGLTSFTGGGGVYRSLDGGDTWVHAGLWNHYISSLAINSRGILFAGSIGDEGVGIYSSDDNGETWMGLKNNVFVDAIAITPDDVIFIGCSNEHGTQGGVFRSDNHGETWVLINTGLTNQCVYGLSLAPDGYLYAYGNHLHRSINPVFDPNAVPIQEADDLTVFPNPFIDFLHFKFSNGKYSSEDYSVKVFDPLGRLVFSQKLVGLQAGTINLSSLQQGLYYISIELNGQRYAKPIIKY